jgi:hypothetical protein
MATPSMGGARPKTTLQEKEQYWLIKPILPSDTADIPVLEHFTQQWGTAAGGNAIVGNDDDHPRNHAAIYQVTENRWRLSLAFDVVPNPDEHPKNLSMQLSVGRFDISREAILADPSRFGFNDTAQAIVHLDALLIRISQALVIVIVTVIASSSD